MHDVNATRLCIMCMHMHKAPFNQFVPRECTHQISSASAESGSVAEGRHFSGFTDCQHLQTECIKRGRIETEKKYTAPNTCKKFVKAPWFLLFIVWIDFWRPGLL
jgi:hypothetical protein